ncbi:UNVERIFIED_CONTAM: Glycoside hydrolase, 38 vacuolar alpha mannosidase [Siphonaria sp. JEL0065]|nr:Glycoside hydrolase, 38 vacuolar alpha mannosidase [Siphonaria sp. JEL0065]
MATSNLNTLLKHRDITIARFEKFMQKGQFEDVNLNTALWKYRFVPPTGVYSVPSPTQSSIRGFEESIKMSMYSVPDLKRIPFKEAIRGTFEAVTKGVRIGPSWSTHWFKINIKIPLQLSGEEIIFYFNSNSEGMIYSSTGHPLQGLTGGHDGDQHIDFPLTNHAEPNQTFDLYIEVACNGRGGVANNPNLYFTLDEARLCVKNKEGSQLWLYFDMLVQIVKDTPQEWQLNADALYTANNIINVFRLENQNSVKEALGLGIRFFEERKGSMNSTKHEIVAIGNCHLDTGIPFILFHDLVTPFDETKRKAARSFATQISIMKTHPSYIFTASQAQQFEWVEQNYPTLFKEIQRYGEKGQFVPVGGTWVEMDTNMPSGEALCRQFLYGQRFFESKFGERCKVFWLPDTFGYNAQLPQICKDAGLSYFLTTKLSWNRMNKIQNSTFKWVALDGSSIIAHLPPSDNIMSQGRVVDVMHTVNNSRDKSYSSKSVVIYGNGDGGGGPLEPMLDRLSLLENVEGLPGRITFGTPNLYYDSLVATVRNDSLVEWKGELYFEAHRGTYTTAGFVKKSNRKSEILLRECEYLHSLCLLNGAYKPEAYPKSELDRLWKLLLLCQFHDVLPGSSIGIVFDDAKVIYDDILSSGEKLVKSALGLLAKTSVIEAPRLSLLDLFKKKEASQAIHVINTTSWPVDAILEISSASVASMRHIHQMTRLGTALVYAGSLAPNSSSIKLISDIHEPIVEVKLRHDDSGYVVENKALLLKLDSRGRITSLIHKATNRESIESDQFGNAFKLFEDIPADFDAWDIEPYQLEKAWDIATDSDLGIVAVEESGPLRVVLAVRHPISSATGEKNSSWLQQRIIVNAIDEWVEFDCFVEWYENRRMLRVEFPLSINSDNATYETQYGVIQRPTHYNTSWDLAKFEVCGHKFADLSEFDFGVALLNDCKYGYSVKGNVLRLSLLRAPKDPFKEMDMGSHSFKFALYPHAGAFSGSDVVKKAYQYNIVPVVNEIAVGFGKRVLDEQISFSVDETTPNFVFDTLKRVEDIKHSNGKELEFILRFYEANGGRGIAKLSSSFNIVQARFCNILEDESGDLLKVDEFGRFLIPFTPFKVLSIRVIVKIQ